MQTVYVSSVWARRKFWTVPSQQSVQSKFKPVDFGFYIVILDQGDATIKDTNFNSM